MNRGIVATTVRVTQDGRSLGIMSLRDAQQLAFDAGLDLVEIVPHAQPPVCQIMDYGKFKFNQSKQKKAAKKNQKQIEMKEIQVRPVTEDHDLATKIAAINKFLSEGRTVQVTCFFSKRESMFKDRGFQVVQKIMDALEEVASPEAAPKFNERRLQVRLRPIKDN